MKLLCMRCPPCCSAMKKKPEPTWRFAVVICRNSKGKYLSVHETRDRGWWIPGGRVEPGETFQQAAVRETLEEAGIQAQLKGILRVEYENVHEKGVTPYMRMRVIFYAEPENESQLPKYNADDESMGAEWVSIDEFLAKSKIRGDELVTWARYLEHGGIIFPMEVVTYEGKPPMDPGKLKDEFKELNANQRPRSR